VDSCRRDYFDIGRLNLCRNADLGLESDADRPELDQGQALRKIRHFLPHAFGSRRYRNPGNGDERNPGRHSFVARSFDLTWESGDSNVVVTGPVPNLPGNFKILSVVLASFGLLSSFLLLLLRRK
jgi:hypothetical protein